MKRAPNLWDIVNLFKHVATGPQACKPGEKWLPARPLGLFSIRSRIKLAWGVFTGKWDAVDWRE
jgi:hypothetical protein